MSAPIYLQPTAPLAPRVLLPGDPGRALLLAQALLDQPRMFNHSRGLWGYTGAARRDGQPLSIQSTGIGGASAAIVVAELAELGARTLVRVGTCGAIVDGLALGDLLIVTSAIAADGAGRALAGTERVAPTPALLSRLRAAGGEVAHAGVSVCTDLFYDRPPGAEAAWAAAGASVMEMQSATLLALGRRRGLEVGAALIVAELLLPRRRIAPEVLQAAEHRLGELAVTALTAGQRAPIRAFSATSSASPEAAWRLLARPSLWHLWAPHIRGAVGLGDPEVRAGARGHVRLAGVIPVPVAILSVTPGRTWDWRVGLFDMRHEVRPLDSGCEVRIELRAPGPLEAAATVAYGPLVAVTLRNPRVAASPPGGSAARRQTYES